MQIAHFNIPRTISIPRTFLYARNRMIHLLQHGSLRYVAVLFHLPKIQYRNCLPCSDEIQLDRNPSTVVNKYYWLP